MSAQTHARWWNGAVDATPQPQFVLSSDGLKLATYDFGDLDAPPVVALHGFAASALVNWQVTGWIRDLTRAGHRVIAVDQRGHGQSDKPYDPERYTMELFVDDLSQVLNTYMLGDVSLLGYSLGSRVSWLAAPALPHLVTRAVLGGLPEGDPLTRFDLEAARDYVRTGRTIEDPLTSAFVMMAARVPGNDLESLISLVEGLRGGLQADTTNAPEQPLLLGTGTDDLIIDQSRRLAESAPHARFVEIPDRNHFSAPSSGAFRTAAVAFLSE
ncbi:alpha/beta hydrolase [Salinibacterium hongtaonis]|nr:alpha/beta hydrolase [Salinibacterium hongtaonis]